MPGLEEIDIPIGSLIPIQAGIGNTDSLWSLARADFDAVPAVETVAYPVGSQLLHLLVHGHHRAYMGFRRGYEAVRGVVASRDEHLAFLASTALEGCPTIEAVHKRYEREWRPYTVGKGIHTVEQLVAEPEIMAATFG